jgi:UDP-N-acetylglucosamine/UDP-N-acetylgalactosamine diphosphorylase
VNPEDVFFFSQEMLPALDAEGRILFATPESLFLAPNGHGGSLLALKRSGALADMRARGIEEISYFQVDNPLVRPADPLFAGLHAQAGCGMSSKVVKKIAAEEKVGVLGRIDGRLGCIEYSDLPEDLKTATDARGVLSFRAGNIAVHMLRVDFVEELTRERLELPWHVARKRMPSAAPDGTITECDGFKFETFVFDALGRSPESVTLEVDRAVEFSSVKNAEGTDSPKSCRADLGNMFARWVAAAGDEIPPVNEAGYPPIEVDPLFAETQAEFVARTDRKPLQRKGGLVYEPSE